MTVIQNQQTELRSFISINSSEITNHNRTHSMSEDISVSDIETSAGRLKRFYKKTKKRLTVQFNYLPNNTDKTVDGRSGRDFISNLASSAPYVSVIYYDNTNNIPISFNGFITNYSETIIRRDLESQCIYYDVSFEIEEQ